MGAGSIVEQDGEMYASGYIQAPHEGDKAMQVLQEEIQKSANLLNRPVRHRYVAANKGSIALIERTSGYSLVGYDDNKNPIYEKIFDP